MGVLIFGAWRRRIEFEDRTLAHGRIAVRARMEQGQPFRLTWRTLQESEPRSYAILVQPNVVLEYRFDHPRLHAVNRLWLRELLTPASGRDMVVAAEPEQAPLLGDDRPSPVPEGGLAA
ncbi:hypothetical protein C5C95_16695 [Rathayibacter sp. AY1B7]|uniref:DUF7882 family protein n=1 Tax=Rathayibacter sp. AY1B7 TaxID=2080532 RepID=UPI000CE8BA5C|nr:hypothetical protein [Rathayibacter sp. AY1B7]PPH95260.1 hypothetical protein C5C95_16695 [Rathayibacter sp. AY1B7]